VYRQRAAADRAALVQRASSTPVPPLKGPRGRGKWNSPSLVVSQRRIGPRYPNVIGRRGRSLFISDAAARYGVDDAPANIAINVGQSAGRRVRLVVWYSWSAR